MLNQQIRIQEALLALLRVAAGWHFAYEGIAKLVVKDWSAAGYLEVSRWWFSGLFHWIAATPGALKAVNWIVPWALLLIGLALMLGLFTRAVGIGGILLLLFFWAANPPITGLGMSIPAEGSYVIVDKNMVELLALAVVAAFGAGGHFGLDGMLNRRAASPEGLPVDMDRRQLAYHLSGVPFLGALAVAVAGKEKWRSYEVKNLVEAEAAPSARTLNMASLAELKGTLPMGSIQGRPFSRVILGGNLLSGYAHARDLIYVSQLVKAYHTKEKIFATLLMAEKCGVNTLLTNPIMATMIAEYWKRNIGKIQFISDCVALDYSKKPAPLLTFEQYATRIKRAIDYGACACYVQGATAEALIKAGRIDDIGRALDLIRKNGILAGIGGHDIEAIQACSEAGLRPDFWMKTLHHLNYWSARHPEIRDNLYCNKPEETIAYMKTLKEPWIAFKVLAAGAIHPKEGLRFAFENGADFVCMGMYDFQMVEDINLASGILGGNLPRLRPWRDTRVHS